MKKKLILISVDAMMTSDLIEFQKYPNISQLMKEGTVVNEITTVYPTCTYPIHATVVSGKYPIDTGVESNFRFTTEKPGKNGYDWFFYRDDNKQDTIIDAASRQGYRTGTCIWPVMGGSKADYMIPEIMPVYDNLSLRDTFLQASNEKNVSLFSDKYSSVAKNDD